MSLGESLFPMAATTPPSKAADSDSLLLNITEAVAEHTDTDPTQLPPLASVVDIEAVTDLVDSDQFHELTFSYQGLVITIGPDRDIQVTPELR